jgi:hypothetical protein
MPLHKLKFEDAKKSATRADVMMLAMVTEEEFSKLRSWISTRFDKVDAGFAKVDARIDNKSYNQD